MAIALFIVHLGCVGSDCPPYEDYSKGCADCSDKEVLTRFHELWYHNKGTWRENRWMGIETLQNPNDVWIAQEVIFETKPDFIVEAGAYKGGSAALWAMILREVNPEGRVISIDIEKQFEEAKTLSVVRERVDFIVGSSTSPEVVAEIKDRVKGKKVLVILDSSHKKPHNRQPRRRTTFPRLHCDAPYFLSCRIVVKPAVIILQAHPLSLANW